MSAETADQTKARYLRLMGHPLGEHFHELLQDAARLHLKWNEFLPLFGGPKNRIDDLNKAASGFFYLVQHAWWYDIILHIFRLTDQNRLVLSIPKLAVPPELQADFKKSLAALKTATQFAHRLRNGIHCSPQPRGSPTGQIDTRFERQAHHRCHRGDRRHPTSSRPPFHQAGTEDLRTSRHPRRLRLPPMDRSTGPDGARGRPLYTQAYCAISRLVITLHSQFRRMAHGPEIIDQ